MKIPMARPSAWPITVKLPLLVAAMMVAVSAVITDRVLDRLIGIQERHLTQITGAYLDGLNSSLLPHVLREDIWEVFDALDRARALYAGVRAVDTVVTDPQGRVLAASDPRRFPSQTRLPEDLIARLPAPGRVVIDPARERADTLRELTHQGRLVGTIYAEIDVKELLGERREVLATLLLTNAALTLLLAAAGYWVAARMVRPLRILTAHLRRGAERAIEPVAEEALGPEYSEFGQLFRNFNRMAKAVNEREQFAARLAEEERLASLGRLASGMAHEINNPLGGLLTALDSLRRHGDKPAVRQTTINLLERGLHGIRDVVASAGALYREDPAARPLRASDIDDLRVLIRPEVRRKGIRLAWHNAIMGELAVPGTAIRQAALNLLLNAVSASAEGGRVRLDAESGDGAVAITVTDEGPGLPEPVLRYLRDGGEGDGAPLQDRAGLGLWMVRRLVRETGGSLAARNLPDGGAAIRVTVPLDRRSYRHVA